jgi:riboflavin kinase/FMN adenylyltransferase
MDDKFEQVSRLEEVSKREPTFLAIGVFDGVHRGHQNLIQNMVAAARANGARPAILTFHPHPRTIISGDLSRFYICSLEERVELLAQQGLDLIITHPFTESVRQTRAIEFIEQLKRHLDLNQLWGGNFALGYNREGDLPYLQKLGEEIGFSVEAFPGMTRFDGHQVSSSRVRRSMKDGNMDDVSGCLGRHFRVTGMVVRGDGRGRTIGIPTANLSIWDEQLLPATGVYATYAWVNGRRYEAATNIGYRPTVNNSGLNVEAHIIQFNTDIYGKEVTLEFVERIRDERKFPDIASLVAQIQEDISLVPNLLNIDRIPE